MIKMFRNEYSFLSNFYYANQYLPIPGYGVLMFKTNEHFFVWCKTNNPEHKMEILNAPTPAIAKKMGSPKGYIMPDGRLFKIDLRPDWDVVKDPAMIAGLELKFGQNADIRQALVATYPEDIQEGNWWNDTYWGVCNGQGENNLGKILMQVRSEFAWVGNT